MNNAPQLVIVVDPTTLRIIGVGGSIDDVRSSPTSHRIVSDIKAMQEIVDYFSKEPEILNFTESLYYDGFTVTSKPNIEILKTIKIKELYTACTAACSNGVSSTSLGESYVYPSKELDQQNIFTSVLVSMTETSSTWTALIWCTKGSDLSAWDMRPHNKAQLVQVSQDFNRHLESTRVKLKDLIARVRSVSNEPTRDNADAVHSINWN